MPVHPMSRFRLIIISLLALVLGGCTHNLRYVQEPGRATAFPTSLPWVSMIYAARTDSGVVVVDLGWYGAGGSLRHRLRSLGATTRDVTDVFLTHSHRDHIGAWRTVRGARFHLAASEAPLFEGEAPHADTPSRLARKVAGHAGPVPGEVDLRAFDADTAFTFGRDTMRAFIVPGHTDGSAAYLFRGVLFVGDAVARKPATGFKGADALFSESTRQNRESLRSLFDRVSPYPVRYVCNAHAKCAAFDSTFIHRVTR
jgi:hydroxyacylglutathione hydrolase